MPYKTDQTINLCICECHSLRLLVSAQLLDHLRTIFQDKTRSRSRKCYRAEIRSLRDARW
jgi:hypothetical protein